MENIRSAILISLSAIFVALTPGVSSSTETKSRMSNDERAELVASSVAQVSGGIEGGCADLDQQVVLARDNGKPTVKSADLLSSFGVEMYAQNLKEISAEYLKRAVNETEAVYGPFHPELALALTDYANVLRLNEVDPPYAADEALQRALKIRLASLGPVDGETLMNELYLAEIEGLSARTHSENDKISAAISRIDSAFSQAALSHNLKPDEPGAMLAQEAKIYVQNWRITQAMSAFDRLVAYSEQKPEARPTVYYFNWFSGVLAQNGYTAESDAVGRRGAAYSSPAASSDAAEPEPNNQANPEKPCSTPRCLVLALPLAPPAL